MSMDLEIKMPDLSTTESEVTVVDWMVEVGQTVQRGQALLEIETDKADMEVESAASGKVKRLCALPGESVEIGQVIAVLEVEKGDETTAPGVRGNDLLAAKETAESTPSTEAPGVSSGGQASAQPAGKASLFARNRQRAQGPAAVPETKPRSMSQIVVGERMLQSKQSIPHFYLQTSANAEPISVAREAAEKKIVWDAFFVKAVAKALRRYDRLCHRVDGKKLVRQENDVVGVAVGVDEDLYVVPIEDPAPRTLAQISEEIVSKAEEVRRGDPGARKVRPGTITITNLGRANVEAFTAIINPPEAAILSIGKIKPQVVARDGTIAVERRATLVLSVDHRVANGAYAAEFLSAVVEELEREPQET